jgi:hypothetical protein
MFILWCWALAELKEVVIYTSIGVLMGLAISVLVLPYTAVAFASPALVGAGLAASLAAGVFIGARLKPKRRTPIRGKAYPISSSEVGLIIETALRSVGERR